MGNNAKMMDTESVDQILGEVQRLQTTMKYADVGYDELIFDGLNKGLTMPRRISKKLSFSIFTILIVVGVLPLCMVMKIPLEALPWAIAASDASILMIAVSYVTGQAKIDVQAVYGLSVAKARPDQDQPSDPASKTRIPY